MGETEIPTQTAAPFISAVLVSFNEAASLVEGCAEALRAELPEAEVVLVDNGADDTRLAEVAAKLPNSQLIAGHGNVGYARGNNLGARMAKGTHILIMNPDTRIVSIDTQQLTEVLGDVPFGLVTPLHIEENGARRFHIAPGRNWFRELIAQHIWELLRAREWRGGGSRWSGSMDVRNPWVGGSIFLARRDEFLRMGGLDERFFIYYEDRDLSDRYRSAGLPIRMNSCVTATHMGGGAFQDDDKNIRGLTWTLLGWLQYTHLHDGPVAARAARRFLFVSYGVIGAGLLAVSRIRCGRSGRLRRKGEQMFELRRSITAPYLPDAAADCYPDAR